MWTADYTSSLNYDTGTYDASAFDAALTAAFDKWESVAAIDFQYTADARAADVSVVADPLTGSTAGTAYYTFDSNPGLSEIFSGEITFNSDMTWAPTGSGGVDFYAVALHEIGHIIGLDHVDDPTQIMNPVIYAHDLGSGDIAGAQYLYGDGSTPPAPSSEPTSTVAASSGGGGGGGAIGLLVGLLAAVFGLIFGGGAVAGVAAAAAHVPDAGDPGHDDGTAIDSAHHDAFSPENFLPQIPVEEHGHDLNDEAPEDHEDLAWI